MAKIGLRNFRYAVVKDFSGTNGAPKYSKVGTIGKAIECKVTVENNSAELYADDALAESDYSFKGGSMELEADDTSQEFVADVLGHKYDDGKKELIRNADDAIPYVSIARIVRKINNGDITWKVEFIWKVKFEEPSQEDKTQGDSSEFQTTSLKGTFSKLSNGDWSKAVYYKTYEEALAGITTAFSVEG